MNRPHDIAVVQSIEDDGDVLGGASEDIRDFVLFGGDDLAELVHV